MVQLTPEQREAIIGARHSGRTVGAISIRNLTREL